MKNAFKIIISAIICLSLLMVPMTVGAVDAEEGIDYNINYETHLTEGTNNYPIDNTVPYTVYIFYPSAVGDYTITSNAKIGIVSYQDMWLQFDPTEETVNSNEIPWTCTGVGQAIMIAVDSALAEVSITVTWSNPNVVEVPWIIYENVKIPEKFEMPTFVDTEKFEDNYVDFEDAKIDDAVLGDDGYYHLNDKNGPVLFANLNDSIMSLYTMSGYGSIAAVQYDDNGDATKKVDYTDAFYEYVSALPTDANGSITSYYYPLTADLIEMFKEVGASHNWYDGDLPWVYASEDAWLYACYYDETVTSMDATENNDNNNDNNNNNNNNNNNDDVDDDTNQEDNTTNTPSNGDNTSNNTTNNNTTNNNTTNNNINNNTSNNGANTNTGAETNNQGNADANKTSPETGDGVTSISLAMLLAASLVFGVKKH